MNTIRITVNGTEHTVASAMTLGQLLASLGSAGVAGEPPTQIASAVNGQYVARQARANFALNDQDAVTTFEPITGG